MKLYYALGACGLASRAKTFGVRVSAEMLGYFERVAERSTVRQALAEEGLA